MVFAILSLADLIFGLAEATPEPVSQSLANRTGCPSPRRRPPLLGFLTSSVFWQSKTGMIRDYFIILEKLVAIAGPIFFSLDHVTLNHL